MIIVDMGTATTATVINSDKQFIGGMIMLMLGMIGEYIGRMYISMNRSPQFVVRERVGANNTEAERGIYEDSTFQSEKES